MGTLYAAENLAPQEVLACAVGQVVFVYGFVYLFKLSERTGCLVVLLVAVGNLQVRIVVRGSVFPIFASEIFNPRRFREICRPVQNGDHTA